MGCCLPARSWFSQSRSLPASAFSDTLPAKASHGSGSQRGGQPHVEATQDQQRASGKMLPISAPWGIRDHKSSASARVVIPLHISPKEQHDTRQGVQSTAFDVLQRLGSENKWNACTGKLGQRKTSVEICSSFFSPLLFKKKRHWVTLIS